MSTVLALATVPVLMAAGLLALMKVPTHLQLTVTDTALIIEPQGLDRWWTRRERIEVPLTTVSSIRIVPRSETPALGGRHGGLHLDGIITAGVFGGTFWDVRRGDQLLMIRCHPGSEFTTLVLQFANPFATLTRTRTVVAHKGSRSTSV
ncbi:hypothetical protein Drose_35690 [Dactylosporangium roseum]|uniref:Bacterial Pleckstrin homology domain-containing protein n=1 Tax=Dactylosporangium roseum TaxID=47989 RepID=A0ABY5Z677_9ACTN|nr:hypothetical protein [Dactylosporangium roseum]UWZ36327.1 hypothetical protein Drose_35690 [Dactylosporangium roseum]